MLILNNFILRKKLPINNNVNEIHFYADKDNIYSLGFVGGRFIEKNKEFSIQIHTIYNEVIEVKGVHLNHSKILKDGKLVVEYGQVYLKKGKYLVIINNINKLSIYKSNLYIMKNLLKTDEYTFIIWKSTNRFIRIIRLFGLLIISILVFLILKFLVF